jgi:hypothetical protein
MDNSTTKRKGTVMNTKRIAIAITAVGMLAAMGAEAAVQGINGPAFYLTASADYTSQPDGAQIYSWGYGCTSASSGGVQKWSGANGAAANCPLMQMPGPTLIVHEGDTVTVQLTNKLPLAAGNASIVFSGLSVTTVSTDAGTPGLLTQEAAPGGTVTYTFVATSPGTHAYYSGTQPDLQIEMGLYGAVVVVPNAAHQSALAVAANPNCRAIGATAPVAGTYPAGESDDRLSDAAYMYADSCYDKEYLFQFAEMSSRVHNAVQAQAQACTAAPCAPIAVTMEPYRPNYFLINGRSMPDLMDAPYAAGYPHQPYNGNPQMHPGERMLMRVIGQGRWQHPFHFHGNHARVLARDGNALLSQTLASDPTQSKSAGPLLFTIATVSGQSVDAVFTWTGQGLNWDAYGSDAATQAHTCNGKALPATPGDPTAQSPGVFDTVTHEYCADHGKPIPVTPPDPTIVANGQWYGGTPYIGLNGFVSTNLAPGTLNQNPGAGYAYMWHSHNEREITTNDVFPGGMMMMMIVNPWNWVIDETK